MTLVLILIHSSGECVRVCVWGVLIMTDSIKNPGGPFEDATR